MAALLDLAAEATAAPTRSPSRRPRPAAVERAGDEFVLSLALPLADRDEMELVRGAATSSSSTVGPAPAGPGPAERAAPLPVAGAACATDELRVRFEPDPDLWRDHDERGAPRYQRVGRGRSPTRPGTAPAAPAAVPVRGGRRSTSRQAVAGLGATARGLRGTGSGRGRGCRLATRRRRRVPALPGVPGVSLRGRSTRARSASTETAVALPPRSGQRGVRPAAGRPACPTAGPRVEPSTSTATGGDGADDARRSVERIGTSR